MNQRISWIDYLKAFTIFMVVLGHMISCDAFDSSYGKWAYWNVIVPFHMPVFAALSGWFFSVKDNFVSFFKKKWIAIAVPYLVWGLLWYFCIPLVKVLWAANGLHFSSILWQFRFLLNDGYCHYGWWFLRALFFCFLVAYASVKLCKGKMLLAGLGSWLFLYCLMWTGWIPNMPDKDALLKGFFYLYPFFWTGFAFRKIEQWLDQHSIWLLPASTILFVVMLFFWHEEDSFYAMNTSAVESNGANGIVGSMVIVKTVWRYLVGATGCLMLILLFKRFAQNCTSDLLLRIGQETLGIYILQSLVYWSLPVKPIFHAWGAWGNLAFSVVLSVVIVLVAFVVIRLTEKNKVIGLLLWGKR